MSLSIFLFCFKACGGTVVVAVSFYCGNICRVMCGALQSTVVTGLDIWGGGGSCGLAVRGCFLGAVTSAAV